MDELTFITQKAEPNIIDCLATHSTQLLDLDNESVASCNHHHQPVAIGARNVIFFIFDLMHVSTLDKTENIVGFITQ